MVRAMIMLPSYHLLLFRHQQILVDGPYRWQHSRRRAHQGARLLHPVWRIQGGRGGLPNSAELHDVQDVLLSLWPGLHRRRSVVSDVRK